MPLVIGGLAGCARTESNVIAPHALPVQLATVNLEPVNNCSTYMGTAKSRKSITLQPQVAGHITNILVAAGDQVPQGAPLIQIDPEKQLASVYSRTAAKDASEADHQTAEKTLKSLQAARLSREADVKFYKQQVDRYSLLQTQGAVSKEAVDTFANKLAVAEAELKANTAQIDAQEAAIDKMSRMVKQSDSTRKEEQIQLAYFTIRAPFSGTVGDIPPKLGEYVEPSTKLTTITQNKPLEVYVDVPAEKSSQLHLGLPVELIDGEGNSLGRATVSFISPHVDPDTQSVLIKALFANDNAKLRSNQTVTAKVIWSRTPQLLVPTYAIAHVSGQDFIFVAEPAAAPQMVAKQKAVTLGDIQNNKYVVKSGLSAGDAIITSGVQNLIDGMPVVAAH